MEEKEERVTILSVDCAWRAHVAVTRGNYSRFLLPHRELAFHSFVDIPLEKHWEQTNRAL